MCRSCFDKLHSLCQLMKNEFVKLKSRFLHLTVIILELYLQGGSNENFNF